MLWKSKRTLSDTPTLLSVLVHSTSLLFCFLLSSPAPLFSCSSLPLLLLSPLLSSYLSSHSSVLLTSPFPLLSPEFFQTLFTLPYSPTLYSLLSSLPFHSCLLFSSLFIPSIPFHSPLLFLTSTLFDQLSWPLFLWVPLLSSLPSSPLSSLLSSLLWYAQQTGGPQGSNLYSTWSIALITVTFSASVIQLLWLHWVTVELWAVSKHFPVLRGEECATWCLFPTRTHTNTHCTKTQYYHFPLYLFFIFSDQKAFHKSLSYQSSTIHTSY